MNYEQARLIGDVGERRVEDLLRFEAESQGAVLLNNLLLIDDKTTAQLDHVWIDRFGVVVVETKNYHALIRGKSDDKSWTACYSGKGRKREKFQNPLRQNNRHREMLHRVLGACGCRIPDEYVQNLVVFAGGNLEHLKVDGADSLRVIPHKEVVDYLRARSGDFQPNPGALSDENVAGLISLLRSADKASDPSIVALHAENVRRATRRFGDRFRARRPARGRLSPSPYGASRVYNQDGRYPSGSQYVHKLRSSRMELMLREVLGAVFMLALAWWLFIGGGIIGIAQVGNFLTGRHVESASTESAVPSPDRASGIVYDVPMALQRLKEASPSTYRKLTNPRRPSLSTTRGLPTYTWKYIARPASNSASVRTISITLSAAGQVAGVTGGQ